MTSIESWTERRGVGRVEPARDVTPLKIALAIDGLDISGGTQRQLLKLARHLEAMGHDVTIVAMRFDAKACYPDLCAGLEIIAERPRQHSGPAGKIDLARRFAATVAALEPDVVNAHCPRKFEFAAFLPPDIPLIWTPNDVPRRAKRWRNAIFGAAGTGDLLARLSSRFELDRLTARALARMDEVVLLDEMNLAILRRSTRLDGCVIRSGVDPPDPDLPDREPPGPGETIRLLSIGIMFRHRRFEDLIRAADVLRRQKGSVSVRIVGRHDTDPKYAAEVRRLVSDLGLEDDVEFIERVSDSELTSLYRWAHVFVFPHAPQTWGLSPFEAMANGTPVLVTRGCGASEVIRDGEQGMVVDARAPEQIAAAIGAMEPEQWRRLRAGGLEMVRSEITWERFAADMVSVFRRVMSKKAGDVQR